MSYATNGTAPPTKAAIDAARRRADLLEQELRYARLQAAKSRQDTTRTFLEAQWKLVNAKRSQPVLESGELWDRIDAFQSDASFDGTGRTLFGGRYSIASDRRYGANWPFWRSWQEHAALRWAGRLIFGRNQLAYGPLRGLSCFVVKTGFAYRAVPRKGIKPQDVPAGLIDAVQWVWDEFAQRTSWPQWELELFLRSRRDGEYFLRRTDLDDGHLTVTVAEPECIIPKPCDPAVGSFGVLTHERDLYTYLGYWYDPNGNAGDAEEVPADEVDHLKVNVDRAVKRGMPDLAFDTYESLKKIRALVDNVLTATSLQSALAWIRQHATADTSQVDDFISATRTGTQDNVVTGRTEGVQNVQGGTILDIDAGQQFLIPQFATNIPGFTEAIQAGLRSIAVGWNAPEWIVSADSSNSNFASSLVADAPFTRRCEQEQQLYADHHRKVFRWVVKAACDEGKVQSQDGRVWGWKELCRVLDFNVTPPTVQSRDRLQEAQRSQIEIMGGWKSRQLAAEEQGYDWDRVQTDNAEYADEQGTDGTPLGLDADGEPLGTEPTEPQPQQAGGLSGLDGLAKVSELQAKVYGGELPREAAIASLVVLGGMDAALAAKLFPDVKPDNGPDEPPGGDEPPDGEPGEPPDGGFGELASFLSESLLEAGFTGTKTDSLGRKYHYQDGKRVAAPKGQAGGRPAANQQAKPKASPKAARPTVDETHAHVRGLLADPSKLTAEAALSLVDRLLGHTKAELVDLKKKLGLKGGGAKADIAKKVAAGAVAQARGKSGAKPLSDRERPAAEKAAKLAKEAIAAQSTDALGGDTAAVASKVNAMVGGMGLDKLNRAQLLHVAAAAEPDSASGWAKHSAPKLRELVKAAVLSRLTAAQSVEY